MITNVVRLISKESQHLGLFHTNLQLLIEIKCPHCETQKQ